MDVNVDPIGQSVATDSYRSRVKCRERQTVDGCHSICSLLAAHLSPQISHPRGVSDGVLLSASAETLEQIGPVARY